MSVLIRGIVSERDEVVAGEVTRRPLRPQLDPTGQLMDAWQPTLQHDVEASRLRSRRQQPVVPHFLVRAADQDRRQLDKNVQARAPHRTAR
jgi:hypothetical protein